jgi:hypothetical protein
VRTRAPWYATEGARRARRRYPEGGVNSEDEPPAARRVEGDAGTTPLAEGTDRRVRSQIASTVVGETHGDGAVRNP